MRQKKSGIASNVFRSFVRSVIDEDTRRKDGRDKAEVDELAQRRTAGLYRITDRSPRSDYARPPVNTISPQI